MRYRLRTLMIVSAIGPLVLWVIIWPDLQSRPDWDAGENYILRNHLTKSDVLGELGPPRSREDNRWVYWDGRVGVLKNRWMSVNFGEDGRTASLSSFYNYEQNWPVYYFSNRDFAWLGIVVILSIGWWVA